MVLLFLNCLNCLPHVSQGGVDLLDLVFYILVAAAVFLFGDSSRATRGVLFGNNGCCFAC